MTSLDIVDGLDRVMGDVKLYARMLKRFRDDHAQSVLAIRSALDSGDSDKAQRIAHTLKGAAGMIGAYPLHAHAGAVELAIRTRSGTLQAALDVLAPELTNVLRLMEHMDHDAIARVAPSAAGAPPHAPPGDAALLARLEHLLANGDGGAVDLVDDAHASLLAILGPARLTQLTLAINGFDFQDALQILRQGAGGR